MNVLLVEPDRILGQTTKSSLETRGHIVDIRHTAQGALDALDEGLPDMIILEPQLGLHNGIEFLYEIRSYPEWQAIPVIIHTLNLRVLDDRFSRAFAQLGVTKVFYKPRTTTNRLVQAVGQFVIV